MNIYPAEYEDVYQTYPITLVDVGASGGIMPLWKPHRQHLLIIGFEPDARAFNALLSQQNRLVKYFNFGLSQQGSEIPFYLTRKQQNSSLGFHNNIVIYIEPAAGLPIQAEGIIPTIGKAQLKLNEVKWRPKSE